MYKKGIVTTRAGIWGRWLLLGVLLCICMAQAAAVPLVADSRLITKTLQAGTVWTLDVPAQGPAFLEIRNQGIDTIANALDAHGNTISESATWRGREGRYVLKLADSVGSVASSVSIESYERYAQSGHVTIQWLQPEHGSTEYQILESLALGGRHHLSSDSGSNETAINQYQQAISLVPDSRLSDWTADAHYELGTLFRSLGQLDNAASSFHEAIEAYQNSNDHNGQAASHNTLGLVLKEQGYRGQALTQFNIALSLRNKQANLFYQAQTNNNIALLYWESDDYESASRIYAQTLQAFAGRKDLSANEITELPINEIVATGDLSQVAITLNNLGLAKASLGDVDVAEKFWLSTIRIASATEDPQRVARAQLHLGKIYQEQGKLQEALTYLDKSLNAHRQLNNRYWLAETLTGLGNVYASVGEYAQATEFYQQTVDFSGDNQSQRANALTQLAITNWRQGNFEDAHRQFTQAHDSYVSGNQPGSAAVVASKHGLLLYANGDTEKALSSQRQSLQTLSELGNIREAARARSRLGQLLLAEGRLDEAERELQTALEGHRSVADELFELDTLTSLSRAQTGVAALDSAKAATDLAGRIRGRTADTDIQTNFVASRRNAFEHYINLLIDAGDVEQAWLVNEQIRARSLLDLIEQPEPSDTRLVAIDQPVNIQILQQQLGDDAAMLSYFLGDERSHLWVVSQDGITYHQLPAAAQINDTAAALTSALRNYRQSPSRIAYIAAQLGQMVLEPASEHLSGRQLIVAADGGLQTTPFALLPLGSSSDSLLIANHTITYTPSARIFSRLSTQPTTPVDRILVLADPLADQYQPALADADDRFTQLVAQRSATQSGINLDRLPGASLEAKAIQMMVRSLPREKIMDATVMVGEHASHHFVTGENLGDYGVIHFATHGVVDSDNPELSGLMMAANEQSPERFLRPQDIAGLELNSSLVVLSGCETGVGKTVAGEGMMSLSRPFFVAGARQVISSLWKVNDRATAALMERFYFYLLQHNQAPEQALQLAQQWMREQPQWQHPNFWAGFVLQGARST